jgi:branched-chain amino acid transport system substrate-binding protein
LSHPTDLVGVGAGPESAVRLVQEMRGQGHKGRIVAGSTIADPELPRLMGKAGDGTTIPTTFYGQRLHQGSQGGRRGAERSGAVRRGDL